VRGHFGERAEAFPVFNGTGANVTALTSLLPRWGAVVTSANAHIHTDEGGAPERMTGLKLLPVQTPDGKLTPELIAREAWGWGDEHRAQPLAVSITQTTELGTLYTPDEVRAIADHAHAAGMVLHMDGARLANAGAALAAAGGRGELGSFTSEVGVDILSLGGTKSGLLFGEAVVVLNPEASTGLVYLRKLTMQLASKMRFLSAQLVALYEGDLWMRSASHANAMAARLRSSIEGIPGLDFTQPTQANALFVSLPTEAADRLRQQFRFYDWAAPVDGATTTEVRWMTAFDTTEADVDAFAAAIRKELGS
jgi:threonine aldolase